MSSYQIIRPSRHPRFTFFCPFTRYEFVNKMLDNINALYLPKEEMEVVFYIDTDDQLLWTRLRQWGLLNQFVYNGVKLISSGKPKPETYSPIPRRARIVQMKEDSKQYIEATEFVFGIEDDTRIPLNAFELLFEHFEKEKKLGFAMGVQQGRWGLPVLGAWKMDDLFNPTKMSTIPFEHETDAVEIDGGGYFCYMTPVNLYKEHKYYWLDECFGPDSTYGIELRKKGYKCLMDFRLLCDHYTDQGTLVPTPQNTIVVEWNKVEVKGGERWVKKDLSQKSGALTS